MDFAARGPQPAHPSTPAPQFGSASTGNGKKPKQTSKETNWFRWGAGVLGLLLVALIVAVIVVIGFGGGKSEASYVNKDKLQAVFLQTGQVYFGNIKSLNGHYLTLTNIYYLQTSNGSSSTSTTSSNTNVSLVKLGCELHAPYDQMVINRDQVTFWENLQDNGQVAKAVSTFQKDNPSGQKCSEQTTNTNTTNVQGSTNTTTNTTTGGNTTTTGKQ